MTFEEALELKNKIGDSYETKNTLYGVFVTPKSNSDLAEYLTEARLVKLDDLFAKKYSRDKQFTVMGLKKIEFSFTGLNLENPRL